MTRTFLISNVELPRHKFIAQLKISKLLSTKTKWNVGKLHHFFYFGSRCRRGQAVFFGFIIQCFIQRFIYSKILNLLFINTFMLFDEFSRRTLLGSSSNLKSPGVHNIQKKAKKNYIRTNRNGHLQAPHKQSYDNMFVECIFVHIAFSPDFYEFRSLIFAVSNHSHMVIPSSNQ